MGREGGRRDEIGRVGEEGMGRNERSEGARERQDEVNGKLDEREHIRSNECQRYQLMFEKQHQHAAYL